MIDTGLDVGLPYNGSAPDLGPWETNVNAAYQLNLTIEGEGGVWLNPGGGSYAADQEVELIAWSGSGFKLDRWEGDISGNADTLSILFNSDKNVNCIFSLIDDNPIDSIRVEAEEMIIISGYLVERFSAASNGKMIRPTTTSFARARYNYSGEDSYHRIRVHYLDQVNGAASYHFYVNDILLDNWEGDSGTTSNIFLSKEILNVWLTEGDEIRIESQVGGQEYGRYDCLDLIKSEYIPVSVESEIDTRSGSAEFFPNPFISNVFLKVVPEQGRYVNLEIYSSEGNRIKLVSFDGLVDGINYFQIDLTDLEPGLYLFRLISGTNSYVTRMTKF
jgi:hypothetical protein